MGRRYVEERTTVTVVTILEAAPLVWALQHEEAGSDYGASYDTRECNGVNSREHGRVHGSKDSHISCNRSNTQNNYPPQYTKRLNTPAPRLKEN